MKGGYWISVVVTSVTSIVASVKKVTLTSKKIKIWMTKGSYGNSHSFMSQEKEEARNHKNCTAFDWSIWYTCILFWLLKLWHLLKTSMIFVKQPNGKLTLSLSHTLQVWMELKWKINVSFKNKKSGKSIGVWDSFYLLFVSLQQDRRWKIYSTNFAMNLPLFDNNV